MVAGCAILEREQAEDRAGKDNGSHSSIATRAGAATKGTKEANMYK